MVEAAATALRESLGRRLRNSDLHIAITGGSSWLGQATLQLLDHAFGEDLANRVSVFGSSARGQSLPSGRTIEIRPLDDISALPQNPYLFLHYAFITKGHIASHSLADYISRNEEIACTVEAAARRLPLKGFFLPSSGAVYRPDRSLHTRLEENPYGVLKQKDEVRFHALCDAMGSKLAAIRVFNLAGPCINNISGYALSSIIRDVLKDMPIEIHATRPVYRSYVHIIDLLELSLEALLSPDWAAPEPFDSAGEVAVEVGELALCISEAMGKPGHPIHRPPLGPEKADNYVGDAATWRAHAKALNIDPKPLSRQITDTVQDLKSRI